MTKYVVTAFDANKGYRCTISKEMSLTRARYFKRDIERDMILAIYQWASDIEIEEVIP